MDFDTATVKYKEIKQDAHLAELYSHLYTIDKKERVKVLMSWLANAYSDLFTSVLSEFETLATYIVNVRLLDTFGNNASYETVALLVAEFDDKFLSAQIVSDFLQNIEKTVDITYYIQVMCEHLTCPSLIRKVMDLVTKKLTPILISRMTSDNYLLAASTMSLIKTLLEFYCEDFWYDLILQYLLPMKHMLKCQRQKMLPEIEFQESTNKLLEVIPNHVLHNTDPFMLSSHFLLYYQDEIARHREIDKAVETTALPSSRSDLQKVGLGFSEGGVVRASGKNQTYPMWVFRYDGTDFIHEYRKAAARIYEEPEEFFEDDLFSSTNQLELDRSMITPIPALTIFEDTNDAIDEGNESDSQNETSDAGSLPEPNETHFDLNPISSDYFTDISSQSSNTNHFVVKDKRRSLDNLDDGSYFGPFLQTLFEILRQWTVLDPAVLFTATELVAVLASSRIPLVNTIFLDMSLTLQPSYPSFLNLIHTIRHELDECMKHYPDYILRNVWKSAAKDCSLVDFYTRSGVADDDEDTDNQSKFVNKLRRSLSNSKSLRMAAEEVTRTMGFGRRGSSFAAFSDIFRNPRNSGSTSEFRLLNRSATTFESEEEEKCAKVMALRSILFTHWMLELGAIALQLSWGRWLLQDAACGRNKTKDDKHDSVKLEADDDGDLYNNQV